MSHPVEPNVLVSKFGKFMFAFSPGAPQTKSSGSGRSVAWLARLFRVQEVVSSNLTAPTIFYSPFPSSLLLDDTFMTIQAMKWPEFLSL